MARRATPPDRVEDLTRRTHQAGVAHYEGGDTSQARNVLEQAVDLSTAGPARGRVLLDLGMGLAEAEGWREAWAVFEAARSEAGDDLALRALIEQNPEFRLRLKKAGFVSRDPRAKERKKYGQKGARKRFQFSKR